MVQIIDGKKISQEIKDELREKVSTLKAQEKTICLAVSPSLKALGIPGRARLFEVIEKVKEVKLSTRLVDDPVCLSADEGMSFEMEKVLSAMPDGNPYGMKATRILEINPSHPIFTALQNVYAKDKERIMHNYCMIRHC